MIIEIITIGDELLMGQVVNTNASWIAQQLHQAGIGVSRIIAVPDTQQEITAAIDDALNRADVVLLTGGLGPTRDDITKSTLCHYFNTPLVFHDPTYRMIEKFFKARGYTVTERNRRQAELPEACTPIPNHNGTAAGMLFEKEGKTIISMPGVPFEMQAMVENQVIPMLAEKGNNRIVVHRTVLTHGVGESFLTEMIQDWEDNLPSNIKLAYLPQPGVVRLRLTGTGTDRNAVYDQISQQIQALQELIPDIIFGFEKDTLEEVTGKLLRNNSHTVSTAESCTGGYLSYLITSVPGASNYFHGSVIAYSNEMKQRFLGVKEETLASFGAVSEQTVKEMAQCTRNKFGTTYALSVSGIAGPDGGTAEKPVGTVWIALAYPDGTIAKKFMFGEHRGRNIRRSALAALNMLRLHLLS
jgi:nicotinamide-nucleotide amidase